MTPDSLQISKKLLDQLTTKYNVHPDFLQILLSFAAEAHAAEGASSNFSIRPGKIPDTTGIFGISHCKTNQRSLCQI